MVHIHDSSAIYDNLKDFKFYIELRKISPNPETENGLFQDSPHIRWEVISWFRIHGSGFVLDKLCVYFVQKIDILWFIFMIPVLFMIIFRILNFILN